MLGTDANGRTPDDAGGEAADSNVVPFPGCLRSMVRASAPGAKDAAARLDRALLVLTQALANQQKAIRTWHQDLGNLAGSMNSLADGVRVLDAELKAASARLKPGVDGQLGCIQGKRDTRA